MEEIYCVDCANFWKSILSKDNLPFANDNSKVYWMNELLNHWIFLTKAAAKMMLRHKKSLAKLAD